MLRRTLLAGLAAPAILPASSRRARAETPVRVGVLRYGAAQWELDGLAPDAAIEKVEYASSQATQVALQGGRVDVITQDFLWVARARATGADWTMVPTSAASGALVAPPGSPVQRAADVAGRRLGVAGSPLDKSWLIFRAYLRAHGAPDPDGSADKTFGPPPLLAEQLAQGRLDAVLTYWPYAARAEAAGMRSVMDVDAMVAGLGIEGAVPALGYVFSAAWADANGPALRRFLSAAASARETLRDDDAAFDRIRPLSGATSDAEFISLRGLYRAGVRRWTEADLAAAGQLYAVLQGLGGEALAGASATLPPGTFWSAAAHG